MKKFALLAGLANIDGAIRDLKGIVANVNERAQQIACSIIAHDIDHGDCSRATALINALSSAEQRRFMVQFLAYFGNIAVKVEKGYAVKVGHIAEDSKRHRKPDVAAAKLHDWSQPYDANGQKADWYEGPNPNIFVSGTMGDVGDQFLRFAKRIEDNLDKTKDNGTGKEVPLFALDADQRKQVRDALVVIKTVGNAVMASDVTDRMKPFLEAGTEVAKLAEKFGSKPQQDAEAAKHTVSGERTEDSTTGDNEEGVNNAGERAVA